MISNEERSRQMSVRLREGMLVFLLCVTCAALYFDASIAKRYQQSDGEVYFRAETIVEAITSMDDGSSSNDRNPGAKSSDTLASSLETAAVARRSFDSLHPADAGEAARVASVSADVLYGEDYAASCGLFSPPELADFTLGSIWNFWAPAIRNASHYPIVKFAESQEFCDWVDDIFTFYTVPQLKKSQSHPARVETMKRLLKILAAKEEPIRVFVYGGSVTFGKWSMVNHLGIDGPRAQNGHTMPYFSWTARLEYMINNAFFSGERRVEVYNVAVPATTSAVGAQVLKYRMYPREATGPPDIIIHAYAPNDCVRGDDAFYNEIQDFVLSARGVRPCDNDLPLIVMLDDMYDMSEIGKKYTTDPNIRTSGNLFKVASWYDTLNINYPNVVRHKLAAEYRKSKVQLLYGREFRLHNGVGYHIGVAWTVLFNLLGGFVDACNDIRLSRTNTNAFPVPTNGRFNASTPLSVNHIGRIYEEGQNFKKIQQEWEQNEIEAQEFCRLSNATDKDTVCPYAWVVMMRGLLMPEKLNLKMNEILTNNDGWGASGDPEMGTKKTGWYASRPRASFSIRIKCNDDMNFGTILYMKSYGEAFLNSTLSVDVTVTDSLGTTKGDGNLTIVGYHDQTVSIDFPARFPIPGGGAKPGDAIEMNMTLTGGSNFKINGLAFCKI